LDEKIDSAETSPVYLKTSIVEPILVACNKKESFSGIFNFVNKSEFIPEAVLRKYLFHLINGSFVKYDGRKKVFVLCNCGAELLHVIYSQIQDNPIFYQDLTIKVE
jgi:hypothetical protein